MRLTLRISLSLLVFAVTVFSGFGWYLLQVESDDLRSAAREETELLAHSVQVAIENALRDHQIDDVHEMVDKLRGLEPGLVLEVSPHPIDTTTSEHATVVTRPLLADNGDYLGTLHLQRPTDRLERDLERTRRHVVLQVLAVVLGVVLISAAAGVLLIGRPLARLVAWMRRIRETGSLAAAPAPQGRWDVARDEVGELEREFMSMLATLRATEEQLSEQRQLREQLQRSIRRVDRLATVGQLAAGLAHEIGSPLQVLNGRARALVTLAETPAAQRHAEILVEQSDRISRIVEQLLSHARRRPPSMADCDVVPLVRSVIALMEHETRRRDLEVVLTTPDTLMLRCDADLVQQVVINLLTNAVRVTPRFGRIALTLSAHDTEVLLRISDTGPGVPAQARPHLFEPFFTTSDTGTGLGLAIVKSVLTEHGGSVELVDDDVPGATFVVKWPRTTTTELTRVA